MRDYGFEPKIFCVINRNYVANDKIKKKYLIALNFMMKKLISF